MADPLDALMQSHGGQSAPPPPAASAAPDELDTLMHAHGANVPTQKPDFHMDVKASESPSYLDLALEVGKGFVQGLNPLPLLKALYDESNKTPRNFSEALTDQIISPPARVLLDGLKDSEKAQYEKAKAAWASGNVSEALGHTLAMAIPYLGPMAADAGEMIGSGDKKTAARGVGLATAVLTPSAVKYGTEVLRTGTALPTPARVAAAPPLRPTVVPAPFRPTANPLEAAAVEFGRNRGVPIDAATATGSPFVNHAQRMAGSNIGGAGTAETLQAAQADALARVGRDLAADANTPPPNTTGTIAGPAVTPEGAGTAVREALTKKIEDLHVDASTAYDALRQMEQDAANATPVRTRVPMTDTDGVTKPERVSIRIPLAVDVKATKAVFQPIYDALKRESELVPLHGGKARALVALDRLLTGPDYQSLSVVDAALGDLKSMARGADLPQLRTQGQGIAAQAVAELDKQVRITATKAGPDVLKALEDGRAATRAKYQAADVLDRINDEPVKTMNTLTANGDANIQRLRAVIRETPDVAPQIARAYLQDLIDTATERGGFEHADKIYAEWQKLGDATKTLMFRNPVLIQNLDNFFRLAKRISEKRNTSETAYALNATKALAAAPNYVLAKVLYSSAGTHALTKGLQMSISGVPTARAAGLALVARAIEESGGAVPTAAQDQQSQPAQSGQR